MPSIPRHYLLLALSLLLAAFFPAAWLEWNRHALAAGDWWRLLTGHWTHLGPTHLGLNAAGVLLLGWLLPARPGWKPWLLSLPAIALTISLGLWLLVPGLDWYRGFSGCLHGLLAQALVVHGARLTLPALALYGLLVAKVVAELLWEPSTTVAVLIGGDVIAAAHGLGLAAGTVTGLLFLATQPKRF